MVAANARTAITFSLSAGQLALDLGFVPVVPPKSNRLTAWHYSKAIYKRRNEIERLFRRLDSFRRIFSRFEKFDVTFTALFISP